MSAISKVGPGWYAVDEFLVKTDAGCSCNCLDYKDFKNCKHIKQVKQIVQNSYTTFLENFNNGKYMINDQLDIERCTRAKDKYDTIMNTGVPEPVIPEPAFLQEIPAFQATIMKVLSIPRGHAKNLWEKGIADPDQIIQHLF